MLLSDASNNHLQTFFFSHMNQSNPTSNTANIKTLNDESEHLSTKHKLPDQSQTQPACFWLSASQCASIQRLFPIRYSFQLVQENKNKSKNKNWGVPQLYADKFFNLSREEMGMMLQNSEMGKGLMKKQSKNLCKVAQPINEKLIFQPIQPVEKYDFQECCSILAKLKKHPFADHFLHLNYQEPSLTFNSQHLLKDQIDLSTVENKLLQGKYTSTSRFQSDLIKIWHNVYACNPKTTQIYKMALQMEKFYQKVKRQEKVTQNCEETGEEKKSENLLQHHSINGSNSNFFNS